MEIEVELGTRVWLPDGQQGVVEELYNHETMALIRTLSGNTLTYGIYELMTELDWKWVERLTECLDQLPQETGPGAVRLLEEGSLA